MPSDKVKTKTISKICFAVIVILFVIALTVIYYPSFHLSFWGDDWYNLWISRAYTWKEILGFFNIFKNSPDFPFYRPLTTQLFFFMSTLGLTKIDSLIAHITLFIVFLINGWLVWRFIQAMFQNKNLSLMTAFFYLFSATHFYRIYALSQFQEIGLAFFFLSSTLWFSLYLANTKRRYLFLSLISFIFSLLAKESGLTLILILGLILVWKKKWKTHFRAIYPFWLTGIGYVLLRIAFFGFTVSGDYRMVFKPLSIINTFFWYGLWSFGIPEDLVNLDLLNTKTIINPNILTGFGSNGSLAIWFLSMMLLLTALGIKLILDKSKALKETDLSKIGFGVFWFIITLLMVAFYPFHKFIYSLTLPLIGISLILASASLAMAKFSRMLFFVLVVFYFYGQIYALLYAYDTHWSTKRGILSQATFYYIDHYIGPLKANAIIYIKEDKIPVCRIVNYPLTREVDHSLATDKAIKIRYGDDKQVFYDYNTPVNRLPYSNQSLIYEIDVNDIIGLARAMQLKI